MRASTMIAAALPFAAANSIMERSSASIVNAITNIEAQIATLNSTVNTLTAGSILTLPTVLKIQSQNDVVNQAVNNATAAASASGKLTEDGSEAVATAILVTLLPNVTSLVQNLEAKKPIFDHAFFGGSVSPQVQKDLTQQQNASLYFANALVPKLTSDYQGVAPSIIRQLNNTFNGGITYFNNTGGAFGIPPIFN